MAANNGSERRTGAALALFVQMIFSLSFPLVLVLLCAVSYLLASVLSAPEFGLWGLLAIRAIKYAETDLWAAVALGALVIAALPLAWVACRQREPRLLRAIGEWVVAALVFAFAFWLRTVWLYDDSDRQIFAYSFLLFVGCSAAVEAALSTLAIAIRRRETDVIPADPRQITTET